MEKKRLKLHYLSITHTIQSYIATQQCDIAKVFALFYSFLLFYYTFSAVNTGIVPVLHNTASIRIRTKLNLLIYFI